MRLSKLGYYRDKFAMKRPFNVAAKTFEVETEDGVRLDGAELEGEGPSAFLVVHGLAANHLAPGFKEFAESMTRYGPTWTIDLRGHGRSGGKSSLGDKEALDVAAATRHIKATTNLPLTLIGFSMGAAAVIRSAALEEPADAVVSVSGPAHWGGWRGRRARRTSVIWKAPGGRAVMRALTGVRIARPHLTCESPAEAAAKLAPTPLLIVHGAADQFFPAEEARDLWRAASEPKVLWLVEDGGHAEGLFLQPGHPIDRSTVDDFADELVRRIRSI